MRSSRGNKTSAEFLTGTVLAAWVATWLASSSGCSTAHQMEPLPPLPAPPPPYIQVPHPDGMDQSDLTLIFMDKEAPQLSSLKECDAEFTRLRTKTQSPEELQRGARELVHLDPVRYHWCFYGKFLELEAALKTDLYLDQKQRQVIDAYLFLTPIARAYLLEYRDSRYLRWAVNRYRRLSEYVFYRKVELTPQTAGDLVTADDPLGRIQRDEMSEGDISVLEKYGILSKSAGAKPAVQPLLQVPALERFPAAAAQPGSDPELDLAPEEN